jgi:hypothetical protein
MRLLPLLAVCLGVSGCAWHDNQTRADCALTVNCVMPRPQHGYGPLHSQVAAPVRPPALEPL